MEINTGSYYENVVEDDGTKPMVKAVDLIRNGLNLEMLKTMDFVGLNVDVKEKKKKV